MIVIAAAAPVVWDHATRLVPPHFTVHCNCKPSTQRRQQSILLPLPFHHWLCLDIEEEARDGGLGNRG
jgi:hypothetical protein